MVAVVCGVLLCGGVSFASTITFDDVTIPPENNNLLQIQNGYAGLNWDHLWFLRQDPALYTSGGVGMGAVSDSQMAVNEYWYPYATISAPVGQTFVLGSGSFMAAWPGESMYVNVTGFLNGGQVLSQTFLFTSTEHTFVDFSAFVAGGGPAVVDNVIFTTVDSAGNAYYTDATGAHPIGGQFVMDNLTVPEGGLTAAMLGMAIFQLALIRRKFQE